VADACTDFLYDGRRLLIQTADLLVFYVLLCTRVSRVFQECISRAGSMVFKALKIQGPLVLQTRQCGPMSKCFHRSIIPHQKDTKRFRSEHSRLGKLGRAGVFVT
jgi:hypothetical protein